MRKESKRRLRAGTAAGWSSAFMRAVVGAHHTTGRTILIFVGAVDLIEHRRDLNECLQNRGIEVSRHGAAVALGYRFKGFFMVVRGLVRPLAAQGVILVRKHDDPAFNGDFISLEPVRV